MLIGAVSATEADSMDNLESSNENLAVEQCTDVNSLNSKGTDSVSEVLGVGDSNELRAGEGSFYDLSLLINSSRGSQITLDKDYKFNPETDGDFVEGIPLWPWNVNIDGNGHTIDGDHKARIFNATLMMNKAFTLQNIKFVNGFAGSDRTEKSIGGAILIGANNVNAAFTNCLFENNWANNTNMGVPYGNETNRNHHSEGGAIFISGTRSISGLPSSLEIDNCIFRNNTANYGGAIYSSASGDTGTVIVQNSLFEDNHAVSHPYNDSNGQYYFNNEYYSHGMGGAIYSRFVQVAYTDFINNQGGNNSGYGGAVSTRKGTFLYCNFINNTCYKGGAIGDGNLEEGTSGVEGDASRYDIRWCEFDNNTAQIAGGAVLTTNIGGYFFNSEDYWTGGDVLVYQSKFHNNTAERYGGGAIMASCPYIYGSEFVNNSAFNYGGAVSAGFARLWSGCKFINNSAAHGSAFYIIEPQDFGSYYEGNYITPRLESEGGALVENNTPVQDSKEFIISEISWYWDGSQWLAFKDNPDVTSYTEYNNTDGMNNGLGYYGFDFEVDLYGHAIEYSLNDVKGGYGQVSPGGAEGIVTDDLSYMINYIDGRQLKEYVKILYYLCNLNETFMNGAFRNEERGELALEFPIHELCYSDLSHPINELMENITKLYDSGFRVPDKFYKLSDVLKDHMAHSDVMVPANADEILEDTKTSIIYRPFLYIIPFHHTHYLSYYQTILTIEKITLNPIVNLGEDVEFEVRITNGGNYSVYDIFIEDKIYDDGLVFKEYKNSTGKWNYDAETGRYNLVDNNGTLAPRTSKSIIFVFTTTKTGVLNNTANTTYGNSTNNTTVVGPDMKVEKITLNKTVYLGNVTMFKIRVTNIGEVDLTNIVVDEVDYDEGLVLTDWKGEYPWFGNIDTKKFVYLDTLKPNESAEFIVIFNTTSIGNKTNYVNASSKQTGNRSANNTTEVVPIRVNVTKEWDDNDNQDGIRPTSVMIEIYADDVKINESELSDENGWSVLFWNLPMVKDGKVINYTVREVPIDNYTAVITNITTDDFTIIVANNTYNFTVTNNHTPAVTNVTVNKVWDDCDNQDGVRPGNVTVVLLADGVEVNRTTLSEDNEWKDIFKDLPKFKAGELINYTVNETEVANYTANITDDGNGNWTVNNTHVPELVNITVNKVWDDCDNQDGVRPGNVTVVLLADGVEVNRTTLSEDNEWKDIFKDLPKFKAGELINYTVNETEVANYTANITDDGKGNWTVNNTHVPELVNITVNKVWEDNDDYDKVRPESITVQLYANGVKVNETIISGDKWEYTFLNLPKYENGELIKYTVNETAVEGYNTAIDNFTITNTHIRPNMTVEKITITKTVLLGQETSFTIKVTNNGNVKLSKVTVVEEVPKGLRYDGKFTGKDWYNNGVTFIYNAVLNPGESTSFNITFATVKSGNWTNVVMASSNETENKTANNNTTVIPIVINVTKEWNDSDDQDGIRPGSVTVELFADGVKVNETVLSEDNKWNASFVELPAYKDGKEIVYTLGEVKVDGYDVSVNETNGSFVITNTHVPEVLNITVNKVWNDSDDQDGVRPDGVTVYLLADGVKVNETTISAKDGWTFTFVGLAVNKDGNAIVYTVEEDDVDNYPIVDIADVGNNTFNVTNTHIPELVNITVKKNWNDSDDQDGVRPDSVTIELFADGVKVNETTLSEDNKWEDIFKDLPKFKAGELIKYTVNETAVANYTVNITDDGKGNFTVNNTHVPEVTNVTVVKVWIDNDDYDKVRPESITVQLYANGVKVNETIISGDKWEYTFLNLPKYENGELIKYTVNETAVEGYNTAIDNFTITNTHIRPNMTVEKITITKTVLLGQETSFTIKVTNNGNVKLSKVTVVEEVPKGLRYDGKFTGKDWYNNGVTFIYNAVLNPGESTSFNITFATVKSGNWTNVVMASSNETENKTANNNTTVIPIVINVTKEWNDSDDQDGIRPGSVTVELFADGVKVNETVLSEDNKWNASFVELPAYKDGKEIVYTLGEVKVDGYDVSVNETNGSFVITNTHVPEVLNITVNKVWNDSDDQDGVRPDGVTVYLLADGVKVNETTISAKDGWTFTFVGLAVNKDGNAIVYTVEEDDVDNYPIVDIADVGNNTFNVTNTHIPELVNITVKKNWNDSDDQDGVRPDSVTIELFADGVKVNETTLSEDNDWKDIFKDLPKSKAGELIKYTVNETKVANYTINITDDGKGNWTVNNTHVPEVISIPVIKVWEDNDDYDKVRPDNITVHLFANGVEVGEPISLTADDDWKYTFENLSKYENGELINYTIKEDNVSGYNTTIENFTITNTHVRPNMTVVKITLNKTVLVGEETSFTINVTNTGNTDLSDITVVEEVPEGLRYDGKFTGENWYANGNEFIYKDILKPGESAAFNITFTAVKVGDWLNKVNATSNETENKTTNNTTTVLNHGMSVRKISLNESVLLGKQVGFIVVVSNTGNSNLTGVYVVDNDFTEGIVLDHMDPNDDWTFDGKDRFTYGKTLGVGESANFTIWFNTTSTGFKVNNVTAYSNETNKTNSTNNTTVYKPDMSVRKISLNESVILGKQVGFTIVVSNTGDCDLTEVYVVDNDFTEGIVLDSMVPNDDWTFDGKDRFTYGKTLGVGESANFTVIFNTTSIGSKINNVTAGSNETNETNSTNKTFVYVPDMTVRKISLNESVYLGTPVAFTVVVTNNGTIDLTGVYVIDNDFTEGIVLDHMVPNDNWIFDGKDKFTYVPDVLHVGESANFTIWFNTTSIGDKINNVTADSNETPEVNSTNKTHVYVGNMSVRKISLNESVYLGNQVGFIVVVTNTGDCDLPGVYVVDNDFTEGIVLDHMVPNEDWTFDGKDRFTYNPSVLGVGESANFTIWFNTTSIGDKINNVTAGNDLTPEVNSTNKTHVYVGDMTVRKISNNKTVKVGEQVSFTIVVKNTGGCDLTGVYVIDDDYTTGLVYDHFVDSTGKWTFDGNGKWTYNDVLGIGEEAQFDVVFNTTSVGFKVNNVTAGNNITNETVNSTNNTTVVNKTVPPEPVPPEPEPPVPVPPQPVPPSPEVPSVPSKEIPDKHATGNPIFVLLLVLFTLSVNISRRKKQ